MKNEVDIVRAGFDMGDKGNGIGMNWVIGTRFAVLSSHTSKFKSEIVSIYFGVYVISCSVVFVVRSKFKSLNYINVLVRFLFLLFCSI